MEICPTCKQPIRKRRSNDISTRFHAHVTFVARQTGIARDEVYMRSLLLACEIEVDGGDAWAYSVIDDILYPHRTSDATNKQLITAYGALKMLAAHNGITEFPEKEV